MKKNVFLQEKQKIMNKMTFFDKIAIRIILDGSDENNDDHADQNGHAFDPRRAVTFVLLRRRCYVRGLRSRVVVWKNGMRRFGKYDKLFVTKKRNFFKIFFLPNFQFF
jgi:hypothetical protein